MTSHPTQGERLSSSLSAWAAGADFSPPTLLSHHLMEGAEFQVILSANKHGLSTGFVPLGEVASEKDKLAAPTNTTLCPRPSPGKCTILEILEVSRTDKKPLLFTQKSSEMCCPVLPRTVCALRQRKITQHLVWMSLPCRLWQHLCSPVGGPFRERHFESESGEVIGK